jgi:hypothetical protein
MTKSQNESVLREKNSLQSQDVSSGGDIVEESLHFVRQNEGYVITDENKGKYSSPRISSELMDCSMPMTFDSYSSCSLGCNYCCVEGTKITTSNGKRPIEEINIGDKIYSYNIKTKSVEEDIVSSVMERVVDELIEIEMDNGVKLMVTEEHPIYVRGKGEVKAGDLCEGDDVIFYKQPENSFRMKNSNPMQNKEIKKRQIDTLKESFASGKLDELKNKLKLSGSKNLIKYNKSEVCREKVSDRMKNNNPMSNKNISAKMANTLSNRYSSGELIPYWLGKEKPDAVKRMKTNNPMRNPDIRRKTLRKIVKSWNDNGRISAGEKLVKNVLSEIGISFIHQFILDAEKRSYVLDFFFPDLNKCIEYDGHSKHYTVIGVEHDLDRDEYLKNNYAVETVRIHRDEAFIGVENLRKIITNRLGIAI